MGSNRLFLLFQYKKMEITVDLTSIYGRRLTGIELFALDLYNTLVCEFKNYKVKKIVKYKNTVDDVESNTIILKTKSRLIVEQLLIPIAINKISSKLVIFPAFPPGLLTYSLKRKSTKVAVVIHDTVMWKYHHTLSFKAKLYLKPLFDLAIKKADFILAVSKSVKEELESLFKIDNIYYIGSKISEIYKKENVSKTSTDILLRLNLTKDKYLLSVSTLEPRKNLKYLLKVYEELVRLGMDKKLVLVGRKGWDKEILSIFHRYDLENRILYAGYLSEADLITLYKNCYAFILLSLYEGFGRTPLEALACGARIIVSDIPVFRENLDGHAIFVPLGNSEEAARIIYTEISNLDSNDIDIYSKLSKSFKENLSYFLINVL